MFMHSFEKKLLCGKRGGDPFLNATRPDFKTGKCPDATAPCSNFTTLDNTICYKINQQRDKVCPITGFEFTSAQSSFKNAVSFPFKSGATFSFSRDVDALPTTKIVVDQQPCADPKQQVNTVAFPTEYLQDNSCFEEPNIGRVISPSFKTAGSAWSTNEWTVE